MAKKKLSIMCASDTHQRHTVINRYLPFPQDNMDVFAYTGDYSFRGSVRETEDFCQWLDQVSAHFRYVLFIPGNHDFLFEKDEALAKSMLPKNVIYLNDSGVDIDGFKFWGSPITPTFFNWAFMADRGMDIKKHWLKIPTDTDALLTHGPPQFILDRCDNGNVGCKDLADEVLNRINPLLHTFGHIHEAYGTHFVKDTQFVNSCICDGGYFPTNKPIFVEIEKDVEEKED